MKAYNISNPIVNVAADDTAFIVEIGNQCFAETYMDREPCTWPNPKDGKMWGYIQGPATVRVPVPCPGKHNFAVLVGGRLIPDPPYEHDFPAPNAAPEPAPEPVPEQPEKPIESALTVENLKAMKALFVPLLAEIEKAIKKLEETSK